MIPQLEKHKLGGNPPSHPIASPHQKAGKERKKGKEMDSETDE